MNEVDQIMRIIKKIEREPNRHKRRQMIQILKTVFITVDALEETAHE